MGREMSWLHIERYFEPDQPFVRFLPMLCQHCDSAPCESVCPVFAPHHNKEGINNQVYNRCIGTRDCNENCPWKVRRFNWFTWTHDHPLEWQLNPDVTVRQKGVMEKCSFCIQRVVQAKTVATSEGRKVRDGEFTTACAQTCPADAIVFGSLMDPESRVSRLAETGPRLSGPRWSEYENRGDLPEEDHSGAMMPGSESRRMEVKFEDVNHEILRTLWRPSPVFWFVACAPLSRLPLRSVSPGAMRWRPAWDRRASSARRQLGHLPRQFRLLDRPCPFGDPYLRHPLPLPGAVPHLHQPDGRGDDHDLHPPGRLLPPDPSRKELDLLLAYPLSEPDGRYGPILSRP